MPRPNTKRPGLTPRRATRTPSSPAAGRTRSNSEARLAGPTTVAASRSSVTLRVLVLLSALTAAVIAMARGVELGDNVVGKLKEAVKPLNDTLAEAGVPPTPTTTAEPETRYQAQAQAQTQKPVENLGQRGGLFRRPVGRG